MNRARHLFLVLAAALCVATPALAQAPAPPAEDAPAAAPPPAAPPAEATPAGPPKVVLTAEAQVQLSEADRARAEKLQMEGEQLYGQGRYKEAIEKFRQAFEISADINLQYSIAISHQQLEAWQECVTYMERFLEKAGPGPKRDRAENTLKNCDARIERDQLLIIESDPPAARVFLDDRAKGVRGSTPFRNYVRPGTHKVWVELDGYEPIEQTIEVQIKEPFRMNLAMRGIQNMGWLHVDSNIKGATVFIDGKNIGLTPLREPLAYPAGRHQIVVDRDGYTRFDQHVSVEKGKVTRVDAATARTEFQSSWRSGIGWTANVLGLLSIAGGIVAWQFADLEFNDTQAFKDLAFYEKLGYGLGGGLMAAGTGLIIWDRVRDRIDDEHRNPDYGVPVKPPMGAPAPAIGLAPAPGGGVNVFLGFGF
ncbi:PEGA domain-containing protein [Myxococcota bacterium]|nr:PEGA domain-containing protein [Myxococcota bacterium]